MGKGTGSSFQGEAFCGVWFLLYILSESLVGLTVID